MISLSDRTLCWFLLRFPDEEIRACFDTSLSKFLLSSIYSTENFCNFGFGNHTYICCILLINYYKVTQISCNSQFLIAFYAFSYP